MTSIRLRLPELRARRRLSKRQLAAVAGVRADTISALERGKTSGIQFGTPARLCEVLGCEPGDLLELKQDQHQLPELGGPEEDAVVRAGLRNETLRVDGLSFAAELLRLSSEPDGNERTRRSQKAYRYEFLPSVAKDLLKLTRHDLALLVTIATEHIPAIFRDPLAVGEPKRGDLAGTRAYNISRKGVAYRLVYTIEEYAVVFIAIGPHDAAYARAKRR